MPNTWSTPSALRHSMMASTARMTASLTGNRGEIEVAATTHADLVGDRHDVAALRALAQRVVLFVAVQKGREYPHAGQRDAHEEPDEEGAALHPPDHATRDAEQKGDEDERQSTRSAQTTASTATTATTIHAIAATKPSTSLKRTYAATTSTATASSLRAASEASCPIPLILGGAQSNI